MSRFEDVPVTAWYHDAVCWAADRGLMKGVGDGKWEPDRPPTRAELAAILYRLEQDKVVDYTGPVYLQREWGHVPYASSAHPTATVKSSGCGPTCMAMVLCRLGHQTDPKRMAEAAISCGAREAQGTNLLTLCRWACKEYGLQLHTTDDAAEMSAAVRAGGVAIANAGGNRGGYVGVMSTGGHYVCVMDSNGTDVAVADPGYYPGKFSRKGREAVSVLRRGVVSCPLPVLDKDCDNRWPRYYIISK